MPELAKQQNREVVMLRIVLPHAALPERGTTSNNPAGELKIGPKSRTVGADKQQNTCSQFAFKAIVNFDVSTSPFGQEACLESRACNFAPGTEESAAGIGAAS